MSLLKRNKDKQLAVERKLAAQHAIVKMGAGRNVRDAYFQGLVFAAVANDDQIDGSERARLLELGEALELATDYVVEAIQCLSDMGDDAKMDVIEESARQLTNVDVAECFLKEFEEIWTIGGGHKGELDEFKSQLIGWMGDNVIVAEEAKAKAAAKKKEVENRRICIKKLYEQWNPFYRDKIKLMFLDRSNGDWCDWDVIGFCIESIRTFVERLDVEFEFLDVKELWMQQLCHMKKRYATERPEDSERAEEFDKFLLLARIWVLVLLSFIGIRKGDRSVHRVALKDVRDLMEAAIFGRSLRCWMNDHYLWTNERWVWQLLTVAAKVLGTDPPSTEEDLLEKCKGWWTYDL